MKILVAVVTCQANKERADIQRRTWAKDAALYGIDVLFFVGGSQWYGAKPHEQQIGDTVYLPVLDDYEHLRHKTQAAFAWAVAVGYDWILKTDDDALVVPKNITVDPTKPYVGRYRGPSGIWREPRGGQTGAEIYGDQEKSFCSGLGYMVNKAAAWLIADAPDNGDWAEDRFAGQVLAQHGIKAQMDWRYIFWPYDFGRVEYYHNFVDRSLIVACQHGYTPGLIERLYAEYNEYGVLPRK